MSRIGLLGLLLLACSQTPSPSRQLSLNWFENKNACPAGAQLYESVLVDDAASMLLFGAVPIAQEHHATTFYVCSRQPVPPVLASLPRPSPWSHPALIAKQIAVVYSEGFPAAHGPIAAKGLVVRADGEFRNGKPQRLLFVAPGLPEVSLQFNEGQLSQVSVVAQSRYRWRGDFVAGALRDSWISTDEKKWRAEITAGNGAVWRGFGNGKFASGVPSGTWRMGQHRLNFGEDWSVTIESPAGTLAFEQLMREGRFVSRLQPGLQEFYKRGILRSYRNQDANGHVSFATIDEQGRYKGTIQYDVGESRNFRGMSRKGLPHGTWTFWNECGSNLFKTVMNNGTGEMRTDALPLRLLMPYFSRRGPAVSFVARHLQVPDYCQGPMKHGLWQSMKCGKYGTDVLLAAFDNKGKPNGKVRVGAAVKIDVNHLLLAEASASVRHGAFKRAQAKFWLVEDMEIGFRNGYWRESFPPPPPACPGAAARSTEALAAEREATLQERLSENQVSGTCRDNNETGDKTCWLGDGVVIKFERCQTRRVVAEQVWCAHGFQWRNQVE